MSINSVDYLIVFENKIKSLYSLANPSELHLVYDGSDWSIRYSADGLDETFAETALEAVLDCLDSYK